MKKLTLFICVVSFFFMAQNSDALNLITNGGFETGDFTEWVTQDLAAPFFPLQVGGAGISPWFSLFTSNPTDGQFAALNGFDGLEPGTIRIAQDIAISPGFTSAWLSFDYRAGWDMRDSIGAPATAARLFDVTIENFGGGSVLLGQNILTAPPKTFIPDTGNLSTTLDLSGFSGQSIRISFDFFIPESVTGPAFFQLDNVSLNAVPEPTTLLLLGAGLVGLVGLRRKLKK